MKEYQKEGLISSYIVIKAEKREEVVEEFVQEEETLHEAVAGRNLKQERHHT